MLIINEENRKNYFEALRTMERDCMKKIMQKYTDVDLSKMTYLPTNLFNEVAYNEGEIYTKEVLRNFKEAVNDLNFYGDEPRRIRVFIRFDPRDWTMHGVNFWRYRQDGHISEGGSGMPTEEDKWVYMFNGGLAFHESDRTWSVHT